VCRGQLLKLSHHITCGMGLALMVARFIERVHGQCSTVLIHQPLLPTSPT
jgi:hypothetical protein